MTRFVIDVGVLRRILEDDIEISDEHELLAPTLIRSQFVSELFECVKSGEMTEEEGRAMLERFGEIKMRLLGDAVLRRVAWKVASQLGWDSTYDAEFVALTQLQADAFVTLDSELAQQVEGLVETASINDLSGHQAAGG